MTEQPSIIEVSEEYALEVHFHDPRNNTCGLLHDDDDQPLVFATAAEARKTMWQLQEDPANGIASTVLRTRRVERSRGAWTPVYQTP